jgi:hypothetical protein
LEDGRGARTRRGGREATRLIGVPWTASPRRFALCELRPTTVVSAMQPSGVEPERREHGAQHRPELARYLTDFGRLPLG